MLFDPDFLSPSYLLIRHIVWRHSFSVWCVLLESFFFPLESACDQHRAN
ncbi:unnamed protein product [Staurois parvus]|uniref:Uncharacterized protein n=1 Tax=Staurois parvus TaxID=386267 RepID=A0ABN9HHU0_9NEOB|nr:unnamed protein product [Staurois parvus]